MLRQVELVDRVLSYDPQADEDLLNRAYIFTIKAHGSQVRASGDPYFSHPIEVAGILTELKLDTATIVTALLHDTIEDTVATKEQIEETFGSEIAGLVDGVTKLSQIELQSDQTKQGENFRKLLLAMSNDIRVLLVKLADRLHNMRTLHFIKNPEKRKRIATETMEIYAPLAERIGMQGFRDDLEDLAFIELNNEARNSIKRRLEYLREEGEDLVERIVEELEKDVRSDNVVAEIYGREKRFYSIWRKMEKNNVSFEQLADIIAFRIVVETVEECYHVLGILHAKYSMVPGRFKDYISIPKRNNYRSLHTTVIGPEKQRIEVQIRTREMHETNEYGVAAHWQYKESLQNVKEGKQYRWLRELLEILENTVDPDEFLEHTKLSMFQDQVFCFTPKGDLISLPQGSSPVDFAYAVHTDVGNTCVGAKINSRQAPLRTPLRNGDQVEILRSKNQTPSPTWESFVVSGKARSAIRRFTRMKQRGQYIELGKAIAEKAFRVEGKRFAEKALQTAVKVWNQESTADVYYMLGDGSHTGRQLIDVIFPGETRKREEDNVVPLNRGKSKSERGKKQHSIPIRGLIPGMAMHLAGCCHPLPGDRIVGIVSTGRGVTIHTIDCDTLEQFAEVPERWLDVSWDEENQQAALPVGRISIIMANEPGALSGITSTIASNNGNINNLSIVNRSQDFFEMLIDIQVKDVRHLTNIIAALRADPVISSVERSAG
ncbi:bifunctional (p)ppGpp synthetase/guanosine-3',5'-bis(diphosphate) 3'-pyrophosphohydrolase [Sneathiella sp.]|uniref:RelA/SpoT family protein n=1 Tax=Sneathiella sp. TaxID=1964365 RepID=UPI0026147480|nr:bifunctional (p)ppGpp synthetase/guanosine-3',5'-bis(diphosphate) 3'-pyrophosphohydrolase [Sneathiella sp.]MDF2366011.1 bifunctional (p)ppGpp synthetase/guanosine-3',5'-bis(diphosphate) 3'-pyrophosphohydrolase [Sneathiella sp.]